MCVQMTTAFIPFLTDFPRLCFPMLRGLLCICLVSFRSISKFILAVLGVVDHFVTNRQGEKLRLLVVVFGDVERCHPQKISQSFKWESYSARRISPPCQTSRVETRNWKHARINRVDQNEQSINQSINHRPQCSLVFTVRNYSWLIDWLSVLFLRACFHNKQP